MMNWVRKFLASKITINVLVSTSPEVQHSTVIKVLPDDKIIRKTVKSDFRFVSEHKVDYKGNETLYYFTEQYEHKYNRWGMVSNSFTGDKSAAMDLHVLIVKAGSLESTVTKTVHWEGLSKDETEAWVILNK